MWKILNRDDQAVETAASQTEAFGVIDWLTANEKAAAPYRAVPAQRAAS
jgi:hypothetical protein